MIVSLGIWVWGFGHWGIATHGWSRGMLLHGKRVYSGIPFLRIANSAFLVRHSFGEAFKLEQVID